MYHNELGQQLPLYGQAQFSDDSNKTRADLWFLAPENPTTQSHLYNDPNNSNGLDGMPVADYLFSGQENNLSDQALDGGQGQYQDSSQQLRTPTGADLNPEQLRMIDDDTIALWSSAPSGFQ
jgi:hypothetical protein